MIHPTAIVSDGADIHNDVEIGPYSIIGDDVTIDAGTRIESHVVVRGPTVIGRDNHFYQFCSIGEDPQDKKYAGEVTKLTIGDRNTVRESCTFSRGTAQDNGETIVGNDNWIMAGVHIAHDCIVGDNTILANNATLAGHVLVGNWSILGGFAGAQQFCRIGEHSFLGAYAYTNRDVPAYAMATGQPAQPRGINSEGLRRRGFTQEQIANIKNAYRLVFRQGLKLADAIADLETRVEAQPELAPFVASLKDTARGILR